MDLVVSISQKITGPEESMAIGSKEDQKGIRGRSRGEPEQQDAAAVHQREPESRVAAHLAISGAGYRVVPEQSSPPMIGGPSCSEGGRGIQIHLASRFQEKRWVCMFGRGIALT